MNPDTMSLLALGISVLGVGAVCLAVWVWRRGWRPGEPPREQSLGLVAIVAAVALLAWLR